MKPLNIENPSDSTQEEFKYDVIPAELKDYSGQVYNDVLYSIYTISTSVQDAKIQVDMIASNLIQHSNADGQRGYWVGVGINMDILKQCTIFRGYGQVSETELVDPVSYQEEQTVGEEHYGVFYFDVSVARVDQYKDKAYIVLNLNGVHYHYDIDFTKVTFVKSEQALAEVSWSKITIQELKDNYLFGIDLSDPAGNPLPEGLFVHYLNSAIDYLQNLLDITIGESEFLNERHDYIRNDYQNWGFLQLSHNPVRTVKSLRMMYGNRPSIEIPLDWLQVNKLTGQITLFPQSGSANSLIIGQTGLLYGFQSQWDYAPALWEVDYEAGVDSSDMTLPITMLTEAIYKRCATGVLNVWGDLIIGAGIASQSVSIDGISQSIGTTQSAMFGGASARVEAYNKDLEEVLLPALRSKFGGIKLVVI